jgi:asparagine synthetase B (glutamine-hydrolysing)
MASPGLANLLAISVPDPARLDAFARRLAATGEFRELWRPHPRWLVAVSLFPKSPADPGAARRRGLVFAQGREDLIGSADPETALVQLAETVTTRPETLHRFPGDFCFLHFGANGECTAVRPCGGMAPLYFWISGECIAICTTQHHLLRHVLDAPKLDYFTAAMWLSGGWGIFPDQRTFVREVRELPRGHFGRFAPPHGYRQGLYWNPRPRRYPKLSRPAEMERSQRLRDYLIGYLERNLDSAAPNLVSLSGGVDSSALLALAAATPGRRLWTWSLVASDPADRERDLSYITPLADSCRVERRLLEDAVPGVGEKLERFTPAAIFPFFHPSLLALAQIQAAGGESPTTLLGGEFADEVCGSSFTTPDWALATRPLELLRLWLARSLPRGGRDFGSWIKYRAIVALGRSSCPYPDELDPFLQPELREEYREWRQRILLSERKERSAWPYFFYRMSTDGALGMNWEATSTLGVRRLMPFYSRTCIELVCESHPAELVGPGTKRRLRSALKGLVPERNLLRPDKGRWRSTADPAGQPATPRSTFSAAASRLIDEKRLGALDDMHYHYASRIAGYLDRLEAAVITQSELRHASEPNGP